MIKINQNIVCNMRGNCFGACVASIFELPLEKVPNFIEFENWFEIFWEFIHKLDYDYYGMGYVYDEGCMVHPSKAGKYPDEVDDCFINGHTIASVPSKTFNDGTTHAVVINSKGLIVHDPNPNKAWQGESILDYPNEASWYKLNRIHKGKEG